jgi:capsular polysaccharide biosynthesis protein
MFYEADVVVGMHGAGMTNNLYMRPGGVVVEVVPEFDSRMAPLVGIFPRLSGIVGLNHYTYYIKGITFDPEKLALDTADYYNRVKLWSGQVV